ncbi:CENPX protein, partial [Falcunculus frontatus]|nr:CENPX protein [Falcunculus frontatus]
SSVPLSAQDTVERLLRLHFRDGRTRGTEAAAAGGFPDSSGALGHLPPPSPPDGTPQVTAPRPVSLFFPSFTWAAEAAARAARQAQAEDLKKVDTEQLEKVLPQLVCKC